MRRLVHHFYCEKKYPTLDSLLLAAKEKGLFGGEHVTLWRILRKMGFSTRRLTIRGTFMSNPASSTRDIRI